MSLITRLFPKQFQAAKDQAIADRAAEMSAAFHKQADEYAQKIQAYSPGPWGTGWNRSNGGKFPGGMSTQSPGLVINNWQVRQQARDIVEDSPQAKALVVRFADTVVDSGLMLDPEPRADVLGITPQAAEEWSRDVAERFHLWASSKKQNRSGVLTFYQFQHLIQRYSERDNDWFARLYYDTKRKGTLSPLQFELLDTNQIRGDTITSTILPGLWADGIKRDAEGVEVSYSIWVQNQDGTFDTKEIARETPTGLTQMLHGFLPDYAGQGRGLSGLGTLLQDFEQITDFSEAYIQKAINQASLVMTNKPSKDAPNSNPWDVLGQLGAGPAAIAMGAPGTASAAAATGLSTITANAVPLEEATFKTPGIVHLQLDSGEEMTPFQSTAPTADFGAFVDSFTSYLCAVRGMPLEVLLMKFNQNYSASRAALLLFWRVACMKRDHLADDLLNPTYESFLTCEIAAGRIKAPGWSDPRLRAAWMSCRWNGTPMPNIDPQKTANADQTLVTMGVKTLDDVARETNGSSGKSNRQKLKTEFAELRAAGAPPWNEAGSPPAGTEPDGDEPAPQKPTKKPAPGAKP